jgi:hypothetical protein
MKETVMESELKCVISGFLFQVRHALLFDIADRAVGFRFRRFGTTKRIHLQVSKIQEAKNCSDFLTLEEKIDVLSRNVFNKLPLYETQYPSRTHI